ncbi:MAG: SDR family NAD(P)-dependent oxidoreductase [Candidatus Micrarchaeota archaeon]
MGGRLAGKVALVTGAGKGIGEGIAKVFAKEGAKVVVADLDFASAKKAAFSIGKNAVAFKCDVSKSSDAREAVALAVKKFGKLDILVNNAGVYPFHNFVEPGEEDTWHKTLSVDIEGVKNCTLASVQQMKKRGRGGKVITISSIAAVQGYAGLTHYCTAKAGVLGFTRALALELAPLKINVNAVCPGLIDTPGVRKGVDPKMIQGLAKAIPWQRAGKPEDIAWACVYLASEESDFVTGQQIVVDGGNIIT